MSEDFSLMQEIDDALRADKAQQFWQHYGKLILAGCTAIVVLTGASAYWKNHQHEANIEQTHLMLQADSAAEDKRFTDALTSLKPESSAWEGTRSAAVKLQAAEIYVKAGQKDKAIPLLKAVVAASGIDEAVHDSAVLRLQALTGAGDVSPADQANRPFTGLALQVKAAGLLKEGKNKEAAALLKTILANSTPFSPEHASAQELLPLTGESVEP